MVSLLSFVLLIIPELRPVFGVFLRAVFIIFLSKILNSFFLLGLGSSSSTLSIKAPPFKKYLLDGLAYSKSSTSVWESLLSLPDALRNALF